MSLFKQHHFDFHSELGDCSCTRDGRKIELGDHSVDEGLQILLYMATAQATAYPVRLDVIMNRVQAWNAATAEPRAFRKAVAQMNETAKLYALAKRNPSFADRAQGKWTKIIPKEIIDKISVLTGSTYCCDRTDFPEGWHLRLHCGLKTCDDDCHVYRSGEFEWAAGQYAGENYRNPGDYGSSSERSEDGDGWDDTPETSWWKRDHESDCYNDRRWDRRDDPDFIERAQEWFWDETERHEIDEAIGSDHGEVLRDYYGAWPEIIQVQRILREEFGVDMLFISVMKEYEEGNDFFIPMVWLHAPVEEWEVITNATEMKKTKKRKAKCLDEEDDEVEEETELKAWYESEHDEEGCAYYGYAAVKEEDADETKTAAVDTLEAAIKELDLWPWLHPMQYMPKDAAFPGQRNGAGEDLEQQAETLRKEEWPRKVVLRCQLTEKEKGQWDGFVFRQDAEQWRS